jgi:hypothetical protein
LRVVLLWLVLKGGSDDIRKSGCQPHAITGMSAGKRWASVCSHHENSGMVGKRGSPKLI